MVHEDDVESLLPGDKDVRDYVTFGCLPVFVGTQQSAYTHYTGSRRLSCSARRLAVTVCGLPAVALFVCIAVAILFHFEESTNTHCRVDNVLPSISTVIGGFDSTNLIWSTAIYVHFLPRLLSAYVYFMWFKRCAHPGTLVYFLTILCAFLHLTEILALNSLTFYNSNDDHYRHVISFTVFGTTSLLHMVSHLSLYSYFRGYELSKWHAYSWRWKRRSFTCSVSTLLICTYVFYRHNAYCEPYVFSVFAFFEYIFVLSNIAFHSAFQYDFHDRIVYVG